MSAMFGGILACAMSLACGTVDAAVQLPDGRAWEMVSPLEKNGGEINGIDGTAPNNGLPEGGIVQAAVNGDAVTYVSLIAFPGSEGNDPLGAPIASQYLSTRRAAEWSTENITTTVNSATYAVAGGGAPYAAFSSDLSRGLIYSHENPPPPLLTTKDHPEYSNYYMRDNVTGGFEALLTSVPPEGPREFFVELAGVTPDLGHVVISTPAALTPEATPHSRRNLYEWGGAPQPVLQPINVLPIKEHSAHPRETTESAQLGMGFNESRTVSSDGTRVVWSQPSSSSLFVRELGTEPTTVQVDASRGGVDPSGEGVFRTASVNDSKIFFTDRYRLTPNSTADFGLEQRERIHEDLYVFDVETNQLTDLTLDDSDLGGASVVGVLEASEDGSCIYFVAIGKLAEGAKAGEDNLYVWHEEADSHGKISFIATLSSEDEGPPFHEPGVAHDWTPFTGARTTRVAAEGQVLAFMSSARLTGYDNRDANTGLPDEEVYLYDAVSGSLTCVSCNPSGARPAGPSGIPGGTPWRTVSEEGTYQSRALSEDGSRVFFDSDDALVPQDTNGVQDVYEWEQDGTGSCAREGGCVYLLSDGTSSSESAFVDASASGNDAFFVTRAQLVPQDTDQLRDLYDARVGGGFPQPPRPVSCEGEGCLTPAVPQPALGSLTSATFSGAGNVSPASVPAGKVKAKTKSKKRGKVRARTKHRSTKRGKKASVRRAQRERG